MDSYTFSNVTSDQTIQAVFTSTEGGEDVRMFIKVNGHWVPLFEE